MSSQVVAKQILIPTGGLLYGNSNNNGQVLSIGTTGQVLTVNASGLPVWQNVGGGTNVFQYMGTLNAATDPLPSSPSVGDVYKITASGNFGGALGYTVNIGDFIVYTATSVWDKMDNTDPTVAGTLNRIAVTGNSDTGYTVDIASTYVGQTSITTLGTVTTGTWNGSTIGVAYGGTGLTTIATNSALVSTTANTLTALTASTSGHVLRFNGTSLEFGQIAYADISGTPTLERTNHDEVTYTGSTVSSGTVTLTGFFTNAPLANKITVFFGAVKIAKSDFSVSGTDLILDITAIGYPIENGDEISAIYSY